MVHKGMAGPHMMAEGLHMFQVGHQRRAALHRGAGQGEVALQDTMAAGQAWVWAPRSCLVGHQLDQGRPRSPSAAMVAAFVAVEQVSCCWVLSLWMVYLCTSAEAHRNSAISSMIQQFKHFIEHVQRLCSFSAMNKDACI